MSYCTCDCILYCTVFRSAKKSGVCSTVLSATETVKGGLYNLTNRYPAPFSCLLCTYIIVSDKHILYCSAVFRLAVRELAY